jgi:hypothetical protein
MIHTVNAVRSLQAVAITVGLAVFLWSTGLPTLVRLAAADSISSASDTITNSAPSLGANHTIVFTTTNGLSIGQTIELTFPTGAGEFVMGSVGIGDVDIDIGAATGTTAAAAAAGTWGVDVTGGIITFETPTDAGVASSSVVTIRIGDNAIDSGTGANQITNPSATSSIGIDIGGTMTDTGQVRIAIVDSVTVSASVDTSLTFTVSGTGSGVTVNGSPTTTSAVTTATTLPFDSLVIGTSETLAHNIAVATNATNGFTVTTEISAPLASTLGDTIDGFANGSDTNTPAAWVGPAGTLANTDTYGHWGLTSDDTSAGRSAEFSSNTWVAASTSPIIVMGHNGPADGLSVDSVAQVGYQIEISALQEASDDYSTTLRYIATPTF